jgi:hypothetical protein
MSDQQKATAALEFFAKWLEFSKRALNIIAPKCPIFPAEKRTRPWLDGEGPQGILEHFTGGPNGVASIRWANENTQNTSSSWHITVFDRLLPALEELQQDFPDIFCAFATTAILHADITKGTWHGNWTNAVTLGIENRNMGLVNRDHDTGHLYRVKHGKNRNAVKMYAPNRKMASSLAAMRTGKVWEDYTVGQILTNLAIGRLVRAWRGCKLNPNWILPHSAVCHQKVDTGPAFPLHALRRAIYNPDFDAVFRAYLSRVFIERPPKIDDADITHYDFSAVEAWHHTTHRGLHGSKFKLKVKKGPASKSETKWLISHGGLLHLLEYDVPADIDTAQHVIENLQALRLATAIYQRASHYTKKTPLEIDGSMGPKTARHIQKHAGKTFKAAVVQGCIKE